jgi:glycerate 2-kinase
MEIRRDSAEGYHPRSRFGQQVAESIHGNERAFLSALFAAAVGAALPARVLPPHLPAPPKGRLIVLGAGKASAAMARAVEDHWRGLLGGLVVTRYGHSVPCRVVEVVEAGHPLPDHAGAAAARRMLAMADAAGPDDMVLALLSGGGSSLLSLPPPGLSVADLAAVNGTLLRSGVDIAAINTVRKHLSAVSGGRLAAAAYPAEVVTLVISDVPGDDPAVVASGPTLPDPTTFADAAAVLAKNAIDVPAAVAAYLAAAEDETPKPGDARLARSRAVVIASAAKSLAAAADLARSVGVMPLVIGDAIEGEARTVGRAMAATALSAQRDRRRSDPPLVLLSGGETTVTVTGGGRGGRNGEFLAGLALGLDGAAGIFAIAADSDGIDGTEDNAGAFVTPNTVIRAVQSGLDLAARLADNDTYPVFAALDDLIVTGPTRTNVNDFRAVLVL